MNESKVAQLNAQALFVMYGDLANQSKKSDGNNTNTPVPSNVPFNGKGKEYLHFRYSNEFEYYACALEILDNSGNTINYFSFPVMPDTIDQTVIANTTIKETHGGVVINTNPKFKPFDIVISGDFGRKFRRVIPQDSFNTNKKQETDSAITSNLTQYDQGLQSQSMFDSDFKTGYGSTKILENILEQSKNIDENYMPYRLFFHNFSLNSHNMVEVMSYRLFQNKEKNMIWSYLIQFKAVAPAEIVFNASGTNSLDTRLQEILDFSRRNKEMDQQSYGITNLIEDDQNKNKNNKYSKIKQLVVDQAKSRALDISNASKKSAYQTVQELVSNPSDIRNFSVNIKGFGGGILKRFL